jgi:serine/threonine-protein kinase
MRTACSTDLIEQFLTDEMCADTRQAFERHLDECDTCCEELEQLSAGHDWWNEVRCFLSSADGTIVERPTDISLDFLAATDDPRMLGRFAGYEISGVVGQGGMAIVLKGFDPALNRYSAIKVLAPHFASSGAARERFAREAQAAAAVIHENVIAIHGVGESNNLPYLIMPYVRGESLQKRIDKFGVLSVEEILRISLQTARALAAAHEQGLVHRDVKPGNILLPDGVERVMITDFGLARAADDASLTRSGVIAGTPQYMSPEQARGEATDARSDLFSLGTVMYVMATGRLPFRAPTPFGVLRKITDHEPRAIRELNPVLPDWLCRVVEKLHSKSAGDRYESATEVAKILQQCLAHLQTPDTELPTELICRRKTNRYWLAGILCIAIGCLGLAYIPQVFHEDQKDAASIAGENISATAPVGTADEPEDSIDTMLDNVEASLDSIESDLRPFNDNEIRNPN